MNDIENEKQIKKFYKNYADEIEDKRLNSQYFIRRYAQRKIASNVLEKVNAGESILEIGCGEGNLAVEMAKRGIDVVASDLSLPNLEQAKKNSENHNVSVKFIQADAENLPFGDNSFDTIVASHILEHLSDFNKGLSEIKRVMRKRAIIALPTCFNPCSWCLLGGDVYWKITRRTPYAIFVGFFKFVFNLFLSKKGVNEGYGGAKDLPHLWRYPWVMRRELEMAGFKVVYFEAGPIAFPYFKFLIPISKFLDKYKNKPILRDFGFGGLVIIEKI